METQRKLATVETITTVSPVPNSDFLDVVRVRGWDVVTKRDEFKPGDPCVYFEIDSFLPVREEFEFLRKSSFKRMGDQEGFRLKTVRLRGVTSQGLVLPTSILPGDQVLQVGQDVTELLGVQKYEPPIPAELSGLVRGNFPSFIQRTDEERVQNLSGKYGELRDSGPYVWTEKLDGSSATFYVKDGEFGVCSRNLDLTESEGNTFWRVARELDLETRMKALGCNLALQGELIGPGVQGNPYKLKTHEVRFFTAQDIDTRTRYTPRQLQEILEDLGLTQVPVLETERWLPATLEELLKLADGRSALADTRREGLVLRSLDGSVSMKVISNAFLLKEKD